MTQRRLRPRPLVTAVIGVVVCGILVIRLALPWWTGRPWLGTLTDRGDRVSIVLPAGWTDVTSDDAGQIVTVDDSGDEIDSYRVPDLAAGSFSVDPHASSKQEVQVDVLSTEGLRLDQSHAAHVAEACSDREVCVTDHPPTSLLVDGHPAISEIYDEPSGTDVVWLVTISDESKVICFTASSSDWRGAQTSSQISTVLKSLRTLP